MYNNYSFYKKFLLILHLSIFTILPGCGKDDDDDDKDNSKSVELAFDNAEVGSEYMIMPYILGDINTINGDTDGNFGGNFKIQASSTNLLFKSTGALGLSNSSNTMTTKEFDHNLRTLHNHFNPRKGNNQVKGFWKLAKTLDEVTIIDDHRSNLNSSSLYKIKRKIKNGFLKRIANYNRKAKTLKLTSTFLNSGSCPSEIVRPDPDQDSVAIPNSAMEKIEEDNYCLVFVGGNPVSETSKDKIKANISETLRLYKDVIYKDSFDPVDSYIFKPLIIIAPFDNTEYWPPLVDANDKATDYKISGAFFPGISDLDHNRPTFYLASDLTKVGIQDNVNEFFHSTLAHEMQHAIMHYYKVKKNDLDEEDNILGIDEGFAHLMEDILGYGEINFSLYPYTFLISFLPSSEPFLALNAKKSEQRGASHALLYYLASQKGGITYNNEGKLTGGAGLEFLASFVKSNSKGVNGLSTAYGGTWTEVIGNYLGSLILNDPDSSSISDSYKTQDIPTNIQNTIGSTGKSYGMKFINYKSIPLLASTLEDFEQVTEEEQQKEHQLKYYQTIPLLYRVKDTSDTIKIIFTENYANSSVAVIKIK